MHNPANDPEPTAPEKPLPSDCCGNGCAFCVMDLYADALAQYEQEHADWQARQPQQGG